MMALIAEVALPAPAAAASPVTWKVDAGAASRDQAIQVNAFLPREISVNVGDTITWTNPAGEFHTVSFLSGQAPPPLIIVGPGGPEINPDVAAPAGGSPYAGTGYVNSGLLFQGQSYALEFEAVGNFPYVCLIHSEMKGEVHVRAAGTHYPKSQTLVNAEAQVQRQTLLGEGRALEARGRVAALTARTPSVTAGIGKLIPDTATLAVMRFLPDKKTVRVGETVTWTNRDPETPHTITFGTEPAGGQLAALAPSGIDRPGHATISAVGQSVNSGFTGQGVPFGTQFQVTFTAPGTYTYICALHDDLGMVGTITVR